MKDILRFILLILSFPLSILGQSLLPPIQNYQTVEYNAASKNWDMTINNDGELFVANNQGLLHFDGEEWALYKLPNNTIIRSVAYIGNKIYTGSYEEFGYWVKNRLGTLEYTSLTHLIKNHTFTSEEFWQIIPFKEAIFFRSFNGIYRYENDSIAVIDPDFVVTRLVVFDNRVIVAGGHEKLFELSEDELVPLGNYPQLDGKIVTDMDVYQEGLLIGTKLNGCYLLRNNQLEPFDTVINVGLKQHQLNQVLPLSDGSIAFGTIKNGIYLYNPVEKTFESLNRSTGLQNNTVLSMLQFKDQMWLGLDNGIDRVKLDTPLSYYTDYTGVLGTVYDLALHKGTLYLGSNTGVYYFRDNQLEFVEGSQGHVWDLAVIAGELFCGHNTGTFKINSGKLEKISNISGGYQMVKIPGEEFAFLQGTYIGISKFEKNQTGQWIAKALPGLGRPVKYLCFEDDSTIWVAHPYKGFNRLKLDSEKNEILEVQEFGMNNIPNNYNIKLYQIKNQIILQSGGVWYKYDSILGEIVKFDEFEIYDKKDLVHYEEGVFWFIDNDGSKEVIQTDLKENRFVLADPQLRRRLSPESENIVRLNDSVYYFTLTDGFAKLNFSKLHGYLDDFELPVPKLTFFGDENGALPIGVNSFELLNKNAKEITVKVAAASLIRPKYSYELAGTLHRNGNMEGGTIQFQNLPFGDYELSIGTVGTDKEESTPLKLTFSITPPWFLSRWSLALYILGFIGIVLLVRWYNRRKLERKQNKLKQRLQREQEELLAQLEKEKLGKEIKLKQKELASTTMDMAKKNELILELKNILVVNKTKFDNQQRYRLFMKKLNSSINDTDDWKRFEVNFKELHEDFFEILLRRYPKLTPKDLKLSAYLKMNLSSKEIAPLMGISTRGVEIHRYRLRKKLKIDGSENISNFLITLK